MEQEIIYETHSTSEDNEKRIASGQLDPPLSEKGKKQAGELGLRYKGHLPDLILCSDLRRCYETAEIAFPNVKHVQTPLLREWDYGIYSGKSAEEVDRLKPGYIRDPFPGGESLENAIARVLNFLDGQIKKYPRKKIMIIGHRSTFYALEYRYNRRSLESLVTVSWSWQPGWIYTF